MTTDEQLLAQFCAVKNPAIFDELVERHADQVRATICRMVRNKADVDDLTQEVFLRAFQGVARFRGKARFSTWLHRIAVNTVYTFRAKQKNCRCQTYDELPETMDTHACPCEEILMQDERKARLEMAMKSLAPKLRAALELAVVAGVETETAARMEGCAPSDQLSLFFSCRKKIR